MGATEELQRRTIGSEPPEIIDASEVSEWDVETDVVVVGGGGCGLVAAMAAAEDPSVTVTVLEKTPEFAGNTSLSSGMIPAAGTRLQREAGIDDSPEAMVRDVMEKSHGQADEAMVRRLCEESPKLIDWFVDDWEIDIHVVSDFTYPGHNEYRMHSPPGHKGANLVSQLVERLEELPNVELLANTPVTKLVADDGAVVGVVAGERRDEVIHAQKVILANNGFAGNRPMVEENCEEAIHDALYFGYDGNTGDGIRWGAELGGELACMDAYQGYAAVASDTGIISTYSILMKGGIMVNRDGERFGDETLDYSAFAKDVLDQPGEVAYKIFDESIDDEISGRWDDYELAKELETYKRGESIEELADALGIDPERTRRTVEAYNEAARAGGPDEIGREQFLRVLEPPFLGVKVTGALFHTQGGLVVDEHARVKREDGSVVPNLYAGGGTAVGISGHGADGYLSGNGLTCALGLGRLAGLHVRETLGDS